MMVGEATSLELENIVKKFPQRGGSGEFVAVDNVSLTIRQGEFLTLLGPSGCGKTTTLRLIAGFESPDAGRIVLNGRDITQQPPNLRDMTMVFQSYALFPHMSVFDNVAYGLNIRKMSRKAIQDKVSAMLDMTGLGHLGVRRPNQLSGGQQQRVALARALVMEPSVLLFDEPLSNLDAKLRIQMRSEIHRLQRRLNITSVYVTHDQEEAMSMSDRIVVMNAGRIDQIGSPQMIYRTPTTRFVADFIGHANFYETKVEGVENGAVVVKIFDRPAHVPTKAEFRVGEMVTAMLRPEALELRDDPALKQVNVEQVMYLGSEIEYTVSVGGGAWTVANTDARSAKIFNEGDTVGLDFIAESVHLLKERPA
jgi:iron(III) transport system ATP-binding protein